MFFRHLDTFFPVTSGRILPRVQTYIRALNTRRMYILDQYMKSPGVVSNGIKVLQSVFGLIDMSALANMPNDMYRLTNYLNPIKDSIDRSFNPMTTNRFFTNAFVKSNMCRETILPVACDNYLKALPLDKPWSHWEENVKPFRLLDLDSDELTFHAYTDQLVFRNSVPTRVIFSLDSISLVLMYLRYKKEVGVLSLSQFLHRYVMSGILQDMEDLWLRNKYLSLLRHPTYQENYDLVNLSQASKFYGYVGVGYPTMMSDTLGVILQCEKGSITPETLLNSLVLSTKTVPQYVQDILPTTSIDDIRQYQWAEYLKEVRWFQMALYSTKLQKNYVSWDNMKRYLRRDVALLLATRFWSSCYNTETREDIQKSVAEIRSCL